MESIQWNLKRHVYFSDETGEAYVKSGGGYVELDEYREDGGHVESKLPADAVKVGTFTNAHISTMVYPS
jgi:hypothetical protein